MVFVGERTLAVSPIKLTPAKRITGDSNSLALIERAKESPKKSAAA